MDPGGGAGPIAKFDTVSGKLTGWARFLSACKSTGPGLNDCSQGVDPNSLGWDGWVRFYDASIAASRVPPDTDTNHIAKSTATGDVTGFAWGDQVVGWIKLCDKAKGYCVSGVPPAGSQLSISCSAPASITAGQSARWEAFPSGGTGIYTYAWTGDDGLSGIAKFVDHIYSNAGSYNANIAVTSGAQTISQDCTGSLVVNILPACSDGIDNDGDGFKDSPDDPGCTNALDNDETDTAVPLSVSCSAPASITAGQSAIWTATPSGGTGFYTYSWTGDDGLLGITQSIAHTYSSAGSYNASVTVTSGAQTISQDCTGSLVVNILPACSDGIDNDGDGKIDFPNDPGCTDALDNNETDTAIPFTFDISHDPIRESAPCLSRVPGCFYTHPHFIRDISITESDSSRTVLKINMLTGTPEGVTYSIERVEKDILPAPGDGVGDAEQGNPGAVLIPNQFNQLIFTFSIDLSQISQGFPYKIQIGSLRVAPNASNIMPLVDLSVNRGALPDGRYILYLRAVSDSGYTYTGALKRIVLVIGSQTPGFSEQ